MIVSPNTIIHSVKPEVNSLANALAFLANGEETATSGISYSWNKFGSTVSGASSADTVTVSGPSLEVKTILLQVYMPALNQAWTFITFGGNIDIRYGSYTGYLTGETLGFNDSSGTNRTATTYTFSAGNYYNIVIFYEPSTGQYNFAVNGELVNVIHNTGGVGLFSASSMIIYPRNYSTSQFNVNSCIILDRFIDQGDAKLLSINPYNIYDFDTHLIIPSSAGGTVALTGSSSALAYGSLGNAFNKSLTGSPSTLSDGSLSNASVIGLSGDSVSLSDGTLGKSIAAALSGDSGVVSAGTVLNIASKALLGEASTASPGSVVANNSLALAGESASFSLGTLTVAGSGDVIAALTGISSTIAQGAIIASLSKALSGGSLTSSDGSLLSNLSNGLSGAAIGLTAGQLSNAVEIGTTGLFVTVSDGTITVFNGDVTRGLSGQSSSISAGLLTSNAVKGISGSSATISQGQLYAALSIISTGQEISLAQGDTSLSISKGLSGEGIVSGVGTLVFTDSDLSINLTGQSITTSQGTLIVEGLTTRNITRIIAMGQEFTVISLDDSVKITATNKNRLLN